MGHSGEWFLIDIQKWIMCVCVCVCVCVCIYIYIVGGTLYMYVCIYIVGGDITAV